MNHPLWPHQQRAVERLETAPAVYLPWWMGSGKTRAIVESVQRYNVRRTLILCPLAVVWVWKREFEKHWPKQLVRPEIFVLDDSMSVKTKTEAVRDAFELGNQADLQIVVVCNYDSAWRQPLADFITWKADRKWDLVVYDEVHRIKAPGGKASRFCERFVKCAKQRVGLSGTPMPHSPMDVYAQFRAIDPSIYGTSFTQFKARYAEMNPFGYKVNGRPVQILKYRNVDVLMEKFNSIAVRMSEDEQYQLPERTNDVIVTLPPKVMKLYRELEAEFIIEVENGTVTAANALVKSLRLAQLANGFVGLEEGGVQDVHDCKQRALADTLEDLGPDTPVVVFTRFKRDIEAVRAVAEKLQRKVWELSGDRKDFQGYWNAGKGDIAAVQIQAGGLGIDLTASNVAIWYSQNYSLGDFDQCRARIKRPGQAESSVLYLHLIADRTIDVTIRKAIATRQDVIKAVMSIGKIEKGEAA